MNTENNPLTGERIRASQDHTLSTYFRVAWAHGQEHGEERDVYTSFTSAVCVAEMLQQAAADRPISVQFSVVKQVGHKTEIVYRCQ
jgi:hypothetical protein